LPEVVRASGPVNVYTSLNNFEVLLDDMGDKYKNFSITDNVLYLPETDKKQLLNL
jgi:hypothetical protein